MKEVLLSSSQSFMVASGPLFPKDADMFKNKNGDKDKTINSGDMGNLNGIDKINQMKNIYLNMLFAENSEKVVPISIGVVVGLCTVILAVASFIMVKRCQKKRQQKAEKNAEKNEIEQGFAFAISKLKIDF